MRIFPSILFVLFLSWIMLPATSSTCCTKKVIEETCKNASRIDPNFDFRFCKNSLQAAPGSRCLNLRGLGLTAIRLFRDNGTDTRCLIRQLIGKKGLDRAIKLRLEDCLDLYIDAVDSLTQAIKDYRRGKYRDANFPVSAAMTDSTTCEDGFKEINGSVSPMTKQNDDAFRLGSLSLSIMALLQN